MDPNKQFLKGFIWKILFHRALFVGKMLLFETFQGLM